MKVRVKKAKEDRLWYADKLGEEFEVEEFNKKLYVVTGDEFYKLHKSDCTKIQETLVDDIDEIEAEFYREGQ